MNLVKKQNFHSVSVDWFLNESNICGKMFKSGLSKFCGRQPLKNYLVHS